MWRQYELDVLRSKRSDETHIRDCSMRFLTAYASSPTLSRIYNHLLYPVNGKNQVDSLINPHRCYLALVVLVCPSLWIDWDLGCVHYLFLFTQSRLWPDFFYGVYLLLWSASLSIGFHFRFRSSFILCSLNRQIVKYFLYNCIYV